MTGTLHRPMELADPDAVVSPFDLDDEGRLLLASHNCAGPVDRSVDPIVVATLRCGAEGGASRFTDERGVGQ